MMEAGNEHREQETEPEPLKRDRRVKGGALTTYLWEQVPRQLVADAKVKAKRERTSIKAVLVRLLRDWTYGTIGR